MGFFGDEIGGGHVDVVGKNDRVEVAESKFYLPSYPDVVVDTDQSRQGTSFYPFGTPNCCKSLYTMISNKLNIYKENQVQCT